MNLALGVLRRSLLQLDSIGASSQPADHLIIFRCFLLCNRVIFSFACSFECGTLIWRLLLFGDHVSRPWPADLYDRFLFARRAHNVTALHQEIDGAGGGGYFHLVFLRTANHCREFPVLR